MQTEFHHVQTLSVMADVLRPGMLEEVQLEQDTIGQIFPRVDELLVLHRNFLIDMETRQRVSIHPGKHKNYIILQIGDILRQQASKNLNICRLDQFTYCGCTSLALTLGSFSNCVCSSQAQVLLR